ncbi:hypothetical protein QVD17_00018 [Tagetes erecta]|uniref:Uncharacterized protein n=1 Tax=Tagetes erecta TaxID=13708 RepID=A0AAD8P6W2_TARER|nr:hypothetical protein QVD17_00018 [Tagetes erecta]
MTVAVIGSIMCLQEPPPPFPAAVTGDRGVIDGDSCNPTSVISSFVVRLFSLLILRSVVVCCRSSDFVDHLTGARMIGTAVKKKRMIRTGFIEMQSIFCVEFW